MSASPPSNAPTSHRRNRSPRTRLYRTLTLGLLAASVGGAVFAGTTLNGSDTRPASATADAASVVTGSPTDRATADVANRDFARTSPSPSASSASPSATKAPPAPVRRTTTAPKPAAPVAPAIPAGCSGYTGVQLTACTLLPAYGLSTSEMPSLATLWDGESGWNVYASNSSSGAYGIPQSLPGDKMASAGPDWQTNAATQIRWGLQYIVGTYGTPSNALAQWESRSPHWY